jgi:hypothetical protein
VEKGVVLDVTPTARKLLGSIFVAMIAITLVTLIYVIADPLKEVNANSKAVSANS